MELQQVVTAVERMSESDLLVLLLAVKRRRLEVASSRMCSLRIGAKVQFVGDARPKYLAFARATVVGFNGRKVVVDLDRPAGRFHRGVRTPVVLLREVA